MIGLPISSFRKGLGFTRAYIHMHTYAHVHDIHTHICRIVNDRHTYAHTYIHIHKHIHIHAYTHTYTYIHIHIHTYTTPQMMLTDAICVGRLRSLIFGSKLFYAILVTAHIYI